MISIKKEREKAGLSQVELAKKLGVTQAAYSQMENAKTLKIETLQKIASVLGKELIIKFK